MLTKNQEYECDIVDTGSGGEGIAKIDMKAVFVPYALAGERVRLKIVKAKPDFAFGKLVEVLKPSPFRKQPACPVFYKCGGCNLQHVNYDRQLEIKAKTVADCFKKIAFLDVSVPPAISSGSEFRYRNKLQLPVRHTEKGNVVGFFREGTHDVVPIDDCLIQREWAAEIISAVKKYAALGVSLYDERSGKGILKHVVAREVGGKLMIVLVVTQDKLPRKEELIGILKERFKDFSLFYNINKMNNNVIFSDRFVHLFGDEKITTEEAGIVLSMGPESFMQVNDEVRDMIYGKVVGIIGENRSGAVVDAYSGAGFLTALLAKNCAHAYGVEVVAEAVDCADKLARENQLTPYITNICGKCEEIVPDLIEKLKSEYPSVSVVLDPPRKGCDPEVLSSLKIAQPERIVYVSCNPATLARDVGILCGTLEYKNGELKKAAEFSPQFLVESVTAYDMFPSTKHVETVCLLSRGRN